MDPRAIGEQIDRILHSRSFANKSQLKKLLDVLFQHFDSQAMLKPDRVIKELWPDEIKTKRSADVATEINRLRHALESYYDGEGKADPIVISLPNRAAPAPDGLQETRWIAANTREARPHPPVALPSANLRRALLVVGVAAVVGLLAYFSITMLARDRRPQSARLDGTVLRIMDANGKELWSKSFADGFSSDWYKIVGSYIWFGDLEGKGHTSVLFSYFPAQMTHSATLICYSDRGEEKWRWTPGRELPELAGSPATYVIWAIRVLKATETKPRRIVVASQHQPWWPSQIALLDTNGKTISEYWHSGGLGSMILGDLDGNDKEEIIAAGVSEYDHQATLVVLDPDHVSGASIEVRPEFQIHGMGVAHERMRLLFQRSDLNRALYQFNIAWNPTVEHGVLQLTVGECITPAAGCNIFYEFDKGFHLIAAYAGGDEFRSAHERFYQSGKNAHALSAEEQAAFQKVRCLVGCQSEFVPVGKLVP